MNEYNALCTKTYPDILIFLCCTFVQGSSSAYGKAFSSKSSKLDLYDRGAGYDENDSFIDNTEAVIINICHIFP